MAENEEPDLPFDPDTEAAIASEGGFCIVDLSGVNWYLQKIGDIRSQKARLKANYEKALKRLDSEESSLEYLFGKQVETVSREFLETRLQQNPKARKSEILQYGEIKLRSDSGGLKVSDTKEALKFARQYVPQATEVSTYKLGAAFGEYLSAQWENLLTQHEGDLQAAKEEFSESFPFAEYAEQGNKFTISV